MWKKIVMFLNVQNLFINIGLLNKMILSYTVETHFINILIKSRGSNKLYAIIRSF